MRNLKAHWPLNSCSTGFALERLLPLLSLSLTLRRICLPYSLIRRETVWFFTVRSLPPDLAPSPSSSSSSPPPLLYQHASYPSL
eukprot:756307-Hanusia_phi.AAC.8